MNYVKKFLNDNNLDYGDKIEVEKDDMIKESFQIGVIRTNEDRVRYLLINEAGLNDDRMLCELMSGWWDFKKYDELRASLVRSFTERK